ncbi:hypothetical protein RIF29_13105 [Crotalaria pallida]|uniref:Ubiquitin fusion degradaton protein n=1 Tax=Crotalaria pallida TaxID=3830 RepID=A0AAN9P1R0_CROPI
MVIAAHHSRRCIDVTLFRLSKRANVKCNLAASLHIDYPMLFELRNGAAERVSHCGVLEFIADEGTIYMPYWMMQNMLLQEGDTVRVKNVTLPKGTYFKLQPHTKDFFDISNPKALLETSLRNFSCLSTGDTIMITYNNKKYYIDIIETKPANAICIIETDCEVDFAPPLDYKKPEKPIPPHQASKSLEKGSYSSKMNPFSGTGRRLNGKSTPHVPLPNADSMSSAAYSDSTPSQGKLVFGSNFYHTKETGKEKPESNQKQPKFQPFIGKKYSLRG